MNFVVRGEKQSFIVYRLISLSTVIDCCLDISIDMYQFKEMIE